MADRKERRLINQLDPLDVNGLLVVPTYAIWVGLECGFLKFKDDISLGQIQTDGSLQEKMVLEMYLSTQGKQFSTLRKMYGELSCYDTRARKWLEIDIDEKAQRTPVVVGKIQLGVITGSVEDLRYGLETQDHELIIHYIVDRVIPFAKKFKNILEWTNGVTNLDCYRSLDLSKTFEIQNNYTDFFAM